MLGIILTLHKCISISTYHTRLLETNRTQQHVELEPLWIRVAGGKSQIPRASLAPVQGLVKGLGSLLEITSY